MSKACLRSTVCTFAAVLSLVAPAAAQADSSKVSVNVPAQDLGAALSQFGQQAKQSLLFAPDLVRGKRSQPINGTYTAPQAIRKLLDGTSLSYRQTPSGAFVLTQARPMVPAPQVAADPGPAEEGEKSSGLEEIVVTAEKKAASLQDTPISIIALGGAEIDNLRISDATDLGNNIPNVQQQAHPTSATTPLITIRGIGAMDDQITQDPSVAIYIDGVYVARSQGMSTQVADLERIEVLRGPQGTLYGRNATGGAINFITRQPDLQDWHVDGTLTAGNRDEFGGRLAVNIPLGETFAARVAYMTSNKDGSVRNLGTGKATFGAKDRQAVRADLRWQPDDALNIRYVFDQSNIEDTPFYIQYVPIGSSASRPSVSTTAVRDLKANDIVSRGHSLTIDWQPNADLTLRSISAYRNLDSFIYQDYLSGRFGIGAALASSSWLKQEQWSQELQLLGTAFSGRLEYVLGAYYFEEEAEGIGKAHLPPQRIVSHTTSAIANRAYALYAQGTWTPAILDDRLHLTLAGRWSKDDRHATLLRSTELLTNGRIIPGGSGSGHRTYTDFSPSFTAVYDAGDDVKFYAKVAQGYKTGGYNTRSSTSAVFQQGFDPESLLSYEVGLKSELFDRRLRLNAALFRSDYDDIQMTLVNVNDPTTSDTINAGKAVIQGIELDLTARLTDSLTLAANYAYLDAQYKRIIDSSGRNVTDTYRFAVPDHTFSVQANYVFPPTPLGELQANVSYSWQADHLNANKSAGYFDFPAYGLLNGRLVLSDIPMVGQGDLSVALWGKNLADEKYWFINGALFGGYRAWGEPRSYGIDLTYRF